MIKIEKNNLFVGNRESWRKVAEVKYHFKYWLETKAEGVEVKLDLSEETPEKIHFIKNIPGIGVAELVFSSENEERFSIDCQFTCSVEKGIDIGFYFAGMSFPEDSESLRLLSGVYSGYTKNGKTWKFDSVYSEDKGIMQTANAIDFKPHPLGTARTEYEYFCVSFPPAYKDGTFFLHNGEKVTGTVKAEPVNLDIWDPELKKMELGGWVEKVIPPRYPYSDYLDKWELLMQRKERWVELDNASGMYHVGFYRLLTNPRMGGPYGYALNDKAIRYKELYDIFESKKVKPEKRLGSFQNNTTQLEIAWGNGCNAMIAYSLFLYNKSWALEKARKIVNGILHFKTNGFQIGKGSLKGAWINAFNTDENVFLDHYGGKQVFLPDQGIVNFFLPEYILKILTGTALLLKRSKKTALFFLISRKDLELSPMRFPKMVHPDIQEKDTFTTSQMLRESLKPHSVL